MAANYLSPELEKNPVGGGVNQPQSGTYGEKTAVDNLKKQLPQSEPGAAGGGGPAGPPPMSPNPVRPTAPGRAARPGATPPPGVPGPLVAPTDRPNEPVNTPLQAAPALGAVDPKQRRLAVLTSLAGNPNVSDETREWARLAIQALVG
jgi:hypothetical protein